MKTFFEYYEAMENSPVADKNAWLWQKFGEFAQQNIITEDAAIFLKTLLTICPMPSTGGEYLKKIVHKFIETKDVYVFGNDLWILYLSGSKHIFKNIPEITRKTLRNFLEQCGFIIKFPNNGDIGQKWVKVRNMPPMGIVHITNVIYPALFHGGHVVHNAMVEGTEER